MKFRLTVTIPDEIVKKRGFVKGCLFRLMKSFDKKIEMEPGLHGQLTGGDGGTGEVVGAWIVERE